MLFTIFYFSCAILGMFNHFFIAFLLLDVFFRFPELGFVIKSILIPIKSILLTFFLIIILEYFFALFAYFFMKDRFDGACNSL